MSKLPKDWQIAPLGNLISGTPSYGINAPSVPRSSGKCAYLRITDIEERGAVDYGSLPGVKANPTPRYTLTPGDIVVARTGASVGKSHLFRGITEPVIFAGFLIRITLNDQQVMPEHVAQYLQTSTYWDWIRENSMRSGQPGVNSQQLRSLPIPVPPLAEQEAIAEALSDADALIEGLERLIAKKRLIKQGAMQDLLTAKRRLPGFSGEWVETKIQEIASVDPEALGAGTPKDRIIKYISLEDVNRGALNGWFETKFADAPSRARRILRENDVLLGTVRPNLQSHHLFLQQGEDWIGSTGFAVLRARPELCSARYLFEVIMSSVIGRQIDELIAGSNYPAISNRDVRKLAVSLPSLTEQEAISEILGDMDAEIQALDTRLEKARQVKEGMMQNLLTGRLRLV